VQRVILVLFGSAAVAVGAGAADPETSPVQAARAVPEVLDFLLLAAPDEAEARAAAARIAPLWRDGYAAMVVDLARLFRPPRSRSTEWGGAAGSLSLTEPGSDEGPVGSVGPGVRTVPGSPIRQRLVDFLEARTGRRHGHDLDAWRRWVWSLPDAPHPDYPTFKGGVLSNLDPRFRSFLPPDVHTRIRLDQVDWGGVVPDGIPPLDHPAAESAAKASRWLKDRHVVFGVVVDGEARAYPKRILAWHEMARDRLGGREIVLAYCTLCGAAIPYDARVSGAPRTFGTSGLLYRSNKLMYDRETNSLWSALTGRAVVGPQSREGTRLTKLPVVTTTWGEWRAAHPDSTVVSLATGFDRDYREGEAYREYFRSRDLMFEVPARDDRLDLKAEVLIVPADGGSDDPPVAVDLRVLRKQRVRSVAEVDGRVVLLVTSPRGAVRAYDVGERSFTPTSMAGVVADETGARWRADEDGLHRIDGEEIVLPRRPAHRAFWFGAYAQWPDLVLVR
jgi:hypothetical protein